MKSRLYILVCFVSGLVFSSKFTAQKYGNQWINYGQKYYALNVFSTGVHRIDFSTLNAAGIPLGAIQSANIQIFGKEKEIPLFIQDGGDAYLNQGDYILFYAEKNDGWLDSTLYDQPTDIGNPGYSLYNDTIQYFLTWNNLTNNLRYTVEMDENISNYNASKYILFETSASYSEQYNEGEKTSDASSSFYTSGEGWGINIQPPKDVKGHVWNFSSEAKFEHIYTQNDAPDILYRAVSIGASNASFSGKGNHHARHTIGTSDFVLADTVFSGYKAVHISRAFEPTKLSSSGSSNFKISIINDQGAATDFQSVNYWSFVYPRLPIFSGATRTSFKVKNNSAQSKIRVDCSNISANEPIVFALGSIPRKLKVIPNGSLRSILLPNGLSGAEQTIIYQELSTVQSVNNLFPVNNTGSFNDFSKLSAEKALLMIYHPSLQNATVDYAAYRMSPDGGQYNVVLANINELYQQFGGGIPKHINGIRRYAQLMYDQATSKPVGLFLMGKGIREADIMTKNDPTIGAGSRKNTLNYSRSFIPSFGQPSCDVCITSNLPGTTRWVPLIPTGRIAASSNKELADYLEKVKLYEKNTTQNTIYNSSTKDWQKQTLHFVGGSDANQQKLYGNYMSQLAAILRDKYIGANVLTTAKNNADPLNPSQLIPIMDRIKNGVSIISFFGHAAPTNSGFEINIDEPSNWNNLGKYPLVIANSCYNGNIFQSSISRSERFVNIPKFGAIAYLGNVYLGFPHTLYAFSNQFYKQISYLNYGSRLAEQVRFAIQAIEKTGQIDLLTESTCTQMTLNGDPMLRLGWHEKPEIEITDQSISFQPKQLDLTVDSIQVDVVLTNLGKSITDTFSLEVRRNFPESTTDSVYRTSINQLHYKDTVSFKLPLQANIGLGINTFNIKADIPSFVDEIYDEVNNNQVTKNFFINVDGIVPVIPSQFAVVPNDSVTLMASTINPIAAFNNYLFEIDTTDLFNSPFRRFATVSGLGGVKEVHPSKWTLHSSNTSAKLVCTDSTVYFWRVAIDEPNPNWRVSSFQYIKGKSGWGQDHFFQFRNNTFNSILYNDKFRKKEFGLNNKTLTCDVKSTSASPAIFDNGYSIDNDLKDYGLCELTPSFYVAVIDPVTLTEWRTRYTNPQNGLTQNPKNNFGNVNDNGSCRQRTEGYFIFRQNTQAQLSAFQNMISAIPDSHYILIYSPITTNFSSINNLLPNVYNTFKTLGSDSIVPGVVRPNLPFAFFCRKGDPKTVVELYAQKPGEDIHLEAELKGFNYMGQEFSPKIGPAAKWGSVFWKQDPLEMKNSDSTVLYIHAFDASGALQKIIDTHFTRKDSIVDLSKMIDAKQYPFIQLGALHKDGTYFTPAQIDRWHVLYSPLPEAAIDGSKGYVWISSSKDTVNEGEKIKFAADIKNIFTIPMDTLRVNYWVVDQQEVNHPIPYTKKLNLGVGQTIRDTITFPTVGLAGKNAFWMEINPYIDLAKTVNYQPEQTHINNLLQIPFYVARDDKNPILDVTFDGRHILNNDIVAPNSEILISLKDDNEFMLMNDISDTSRFGIYLTHPDGNQERIPFMDGNKKVMQWIPADGKNKKFKIIYPGYFPKSGKYTLQVQGSDRAGNLSGQFEYRINFQVIHESMISYLINYPNPFSTSTRFVFTLTGSETPDQMLIQIMTVSGKIVREITEKELGAIHIGRNVSEYAWDGKDEFGDPLANGIYLYRVKAQINKKDIKHYQSGADDHFKENFGKMYLLR